MKKNKTDVGARSLRGFSLVEVNLAILLVGVGLFAIFALFPRGLQESDMAVQDTHEAMFGNAVISAIEGNAAAIADWDTWTDLSALSGALREGMIMRNIVLTADGGGLKATDTALMFPPNSNPQRYITYQLLVLPRGDTQGRLIKVFLKVASGRDRSLATCRDYYTELIYTRE